MLELYSLLLSERRADVKRYCADNNIDELDVDEATKAEIALGKYLSKINCIFCTKIF